MSEVPEHGARAAFRGHPTRWDEEDERWRYEDTGEPTLGYGGELRPCKVCGSEHGLHEPDPCLGQLPGVDNACCGHGDRQRAYVRFTNGVVLEGFEVRSGPADPPTEDDNGC